MGRSTKKGPYVDQKLLKKVISENKVEIEGKSPKKKYLKRKKTCYSTAKNKKKKDKYKEKKLLK